MRSPTPPGVPRPGGIPENVARELERLGVRVEGLEQDVAEIERRLEATDHGKQSKLEEKLEKYEEREREREADEAKKVAAIAKDRSTRTFEIVKLLLAAIIGSGATTAVGAMRDGCKAPAPAQVVVPVVSPPAAPSSDAGAR